MTQERARWERSLHPCRGVALALLFAVASFGAVLGLITHPGPGLDPDSMQYLGAAESFSESGALRIPVGEWDSTAGTAPFSHFPPAFSVAIAAGTRLGASSRDAARAVAALSAALAAGAVVWLAAVSTGGLAAVVTGTTLLLSPGIVLDHLIVLSEPLFLALLAVTFACLVRLPDRPLVHGLGAALASSVRYSGIALAGAATLWALRAPGTRWRWRGVVSAAGPTLAVQGAWLLHAWLESAPVRTLGLRGGLSRTLAEGLATCREWLLPGAPASAAAGVLGLLTAFLGGLLLVRAARRERALLPAAGITAGCYAVFLLAARLFADGEIPFDERMLSPLFLLAGLALAVSAAVLARDAPPAARIAGALVLAAWLTASVRRTVVQVEDARDGGWGYAAEEWTSSELVHWLQTEGRRFALFSNSPADVWFATRRPSWKLPTSIDLVTLKNFGRIVRERHGAVVGFAEGSEQTADPSQLASRLGLVEVVRFTEAVVWAPGPL